MRSESFGIARTVEKSEEGRGGRTEEEIGTRNVGPGTTSG